MLEELLSLIQGAGTHFILPAAVIARLAVLSSPRGSEPRARFRFAFALLIAHVFLLLIAVLVSGLRLEVTQALRAAVSLSATLAAVTLGSVILFEGVIHRFRPSLPRIVSDLMTMLAAGVGVMRTSAQLGFELTGLIATSAVLTAVVGLSLQDTLGNALGGLALQLDSSVKVGDWVKLGDVSGRVSEIRWRYTAIETRNWETVVVPNSLLMRSQVTILGRRQGQPIQLRRWVYFQIDYRHAPSDVISVVETALLVQPIANVAVAPAPNCIAFEFTDSQTRYAVRYWLTDLAVDDPTDSLVRNRIYYALARAGIPLAIPAQKLFVTEDDHARDVRKRAEEDQRRMAALRSIDLFANLSDDERSELAMRLTPAPFAKGETITREGADAHHLYVIMQGEVSIRVGGLTQNHEVSRLREGDFFGEMALLTGERRRATCLAVSDVSCYRLDAEAFRELLSRHPDLAERVALVLAERETALASAQERMGAAQRERLRAQKERALVSRIRAFFELD